jgi:hypothetical protein
MVVGTFSFPKQPENSSTGATEIKKEVRTRLPIKIPIEPSMEESADTSHCLSLMSQEVQRDGTLANVTGQRNNIFQSV